MKIYLSMFTSTVLHQWLRIDQEYIKEMIVVRRRITKYLHFRLIILKNGAYSGQTRLANALMNDHYF